MNQEEVFKAPDPVLDEEGYFISFDVQTCTLEEIRDCYDKYGLVVFKNIVNQQEIDRTVDQLWKQTIDYYDQATGKKIERENPETWHYIKGWQKNFGFVNDTIISQNQFWLNRKNPKVYQSFKKTYEASSGKTMKEPLLCSLDRGSMILPGALSPGWVNNQLYHFDINPWVWVEMVENDEPRLTYEENQAFLLLGEGNYTPNVGYTKLAGVLALSDTNNTSGGFQAACGFQNYIKKWCELKPYYTDITQDQNLMKNFKRIFMKKGSLLVFSRELPHNIYPNVSQNFRYAQYLRMSPQSALDLTPQEKQARKALVGKLLPKNIDFSDPISRQIFMLNQEKEQKTAI